MQEIGGLILQLLSTLAIGLVLADVCLESVHQELGKKFRYRRFLLLFLALLAAIMVLINVTLENESALEIQSAKLLCVAVGVFIRIGFMRWKK